MNTFLSGLDAEIIYGDALTDDAKGLIPADLILANPPFGNKAGSKRPIRKDIPFSNTNKQLAFLQHIYLGLKDGGRAAVVLPDSVLFEDGLAKSVREDLMARCNLHTILRLPKGIFASAGVKTNVLFFSRGGNTNAIWFYDLRANMPAFGKTTPLKLDHFAEFEACFGREPDGRAEREDQGESGRFRRFSRAEIADRDEDLNISWLRDDSDDTFGTPGEIAAAILGHLRAALSEMEAVADDLDEPATGQE